MTITNWADIDIKLVEPMQAAGISTVEDLLRAVKIAQACNKLEEETGIDNERLIKITKTLNELLSDQNQLIQTDPVSAEFKDAVKSALEENKELLGRLS